MCNNIGALFKNKKRSGPRSPHVTGVLELEPDQVTALYTRIQNGDPATLNLAGWRNIAKKTKEKYITLKAQVPFPKEPSATLPLEADDDPFTL